MSFAESYLAETAAIAEQLDASSVERLATELAAVRDGGGRLFVLGVGGSAAHAVETSDRTTASINPRAELRQLRVENAVMPRIRCPR